MAFQKLVSFAQKVQDLADRPSISSADLKAAFDAAPDEVRVYLNKLIDALKSTTSGDSGAKNIGATSISGLTGSDVQTLLESLKKAIDNTVAGQVTPSQIGIQSGSVDVTSNTSSSSTTVTVTFPKAYASKPRVFTSSTNVSLGGKRIITNPYNITTTGFTFGVATTDANFFSTVQTLEFLWMAIG